MEPHLFFLMTWYWQKKETHKFNSFVFLYWLYLERVHDCPLCHFPQLLNLLFTWPYLLEKNGIQMASYTLFELGWCQASWGHFWHPGREVYFITHKQRLSGTICMKQFTEPMTHFSRWYSWRTSLSAFCPDLPSVIFSNWLSSVFNTLPMYIPQADLFPFLTGNMQS